jgi:hypothetical protein
VTRWVGIAKYDVGKRVSRLLARKVGKENSLDVRKFNPLIHQNGTNGVDHDNDITSPESTPGRHLGDKIVTTFLEVQIRSVPADAIPFGESLARVRIGENNAQLQVLEVGLVVVKDLGRRCVFQVLVEFDGRSVKLSAEGLDGRN